VSENEQEAESEEHDADNILTKETLMIWTMVDGKLMPN
jgi:hypothetical protein